MVPNSHAETVLVLAPTGRDAALISTTLTHNGITCKPCSDVGCLCEALRQGAGAALVAEEALLPEALSLLTQALRTQPTWSDVPLIVLSITGESTSATDLRLNRVGVLGNVTVIERPVRPATLVSVVRSALRARKRQFEVERLLRDLEVAQERLHTMVESVGDHAIINLDGEGRVTYWNAGAERLLGYSEHEILGAGYERIFAPDDRANSVPTNELQTAVEKGRAESEGWRLRADGSRFWGSGVISPIRNAGGEITGFVKVLRDRTEQKRADEKLAEQARALQRSNEDLQRFAYVASHDLQEPLRMVASYSQLLVRKNADRIDEDSKQFARFIVTGVERMRTLIRDLLEYSRLTTETHLELQVVDANAVLGLALQNLQFKISETGAVITFDHMPVILAHETRLLQVFQNLLGNALKYCQTTPEIHVSAVRNGKWWRIAVQDNGIGIAPEHQGKLFGLFQRLHSRTEYPGSGIGLATCKRIIEQHGGDMWLESAKGHGSTFFFTVPAADAAAFSSSDSARAG